VNLSTQRLERIAAGNSLLVDRLNASRNKMQSYQLLRETHENIEGVGLTMLDALLLRRGLGVTDPPDMIYGHLGIASEFQNDGQDSPKMLASYHISYHDVLVSATKKIMQTSKSLAILRYADGLKIPGVPSWVTDWSKATQYQSFDYPELF
jgi:hypothetical protein